MAEFIQSIGVWGVALTLGTFALGTWLNKKTGQAIFNPLLLGSIFVIVFLSLVQIPFGAYKESVSFLSYLLLPATVSLAVPLYEQWLPMKKNALAVLCGIAAGAFTVCILLLINLTPFQNYTSLNPSSQRVLVIRLTCSKSLVSISMRRKQPLTLSVLPFS